MKHFNFFSTASDLLPCLAPDGGKFTTGKSKWSCLKQRKKNSLGITGF